jgi:hypothetical protein
MLFIKRLLKSQDDEFPVNRLTSIAGDGFLMAVRIYYSKSRRNKKVMCLLETV